MRIEAWSPEQVRKLVAIAKAKGVTQETLASDYIGCSLAALGHWMRGADGRRPNRSYRLALTLAQILLLSESPPEFEPVSEDGDDDA